MDKHDVSLVMLESAMMHLQKANKRLATITLVALVIMGLMFGFFVYLFSTFGITTDFILL